MVLLHDCIPCQYGHHEEHQDVPGPVAEGIIGGWRCPCTGDCVERNKGRYSEVIEVEVDPEIERQWAETFEFLKSVSEAQHD